MDAIRIAGAGLTAAAARYTASAQSVASDSGDIAQQLVELSLAKVAGEASAAVVKTTSDVSKRLVDILA